MPIFKYTCPKCENSQDLLVAKDEKDEQKCSSCDVLMVRKFPTPNIPRDKSPYDLLDGPAATRASGNPARQGRGRGKAKWRDK